MKKISLSASKIKLFETCSWAYYCKYHLKLKDPPNSGAARGTVSHLVFEVLMNSRHRIEFDKIIAANSVEASKSITRLINKHCHKLNIMDAEHIQLIYNMVLVGLKNDFFCNGAEKVEAEQEFKFEASNYIINGFIDKTAIHKDKIEIIDYKSSKQKFTDEEIDYNLQNLMYSLACFKTNGVIPRVKFVFLRFPKKPDQIAPQCNEHTLKGFEAFLNKIATKIANFNEISAKKNLAANIQYKKWLCGKNEFRGQCKNDGSQVWGCPYKFPFKYYALIDKNNSIIATSETNDLQVGEGQSIVEKLYDGCPAFKSKKTPTIIADF